MVAYITIIQSALIIGKTHISNIKFFKVGSAENKPKESVTTKNVLKKIETFLCNIFLLKVKKKKFLVTGFNVKKGQRLIMKNSVGDRVRKYLMCGRCRTDFILFSKHRQFD